MKPTYAFACTYEFDGGIWPVILYAYDIEDAQIRCEKLGLTLGSQVDKDVRQGLLDWTSVALMLLVFLILIAAAAWKLAD